MRMRWNLSLVLQIVLVSHRIAPGWVLSIRKPSRALRSPVNLLGSNSHHPLAHDAQQIQTSAAPRKCLPHSQPVDNAPLYGWFNSQTSTLHVGINVPQRCTQPHPFPPKRVRNANPWLHKHCLGMSPRSQSLPGLLPAFGSQWPKIRQGSNLCPQHSELG